MIMTNYNNVIKIIDARVNKHRKFLDENFGVGAEHPTIGIYNFMLNELHEVKKEIILLNKVENCNNSSELIEILSKNKLNDEFVEVLKGLLNAS